MWPLGGETGGGKSSQSVDDLIQHRLEPPPTWCALQPRLISAIGPAHRVSAERRQATGQDTICTPQTGVLLKRMQSEGLLNDVSHVVVDGAHERTDLLLALLKRADLKVVLASATTDADDYLGSTASIRSRRPTTPAMPSAWWHCVDPTGGPPLFLCTHGEAEDRIQQASGSDSEASSSKLKRSPSSSTNSGRRVLARKAHLIGSARTVSPLQPQGGKIRKDLQREGNEVACQFFQLLSARAAIGPYLETIRPDKYWWCGGGERQSRQYPLAKCQAWQAQIKELWRSIGKACEWKHPRAPTVRLLFRDSQAALAVLTSLRDTNSGASGDRALARGGGGPGRQGRGGPRLYFSFVYFLYPLF